MTNKQIDEAQDQFYTLISQFIQDFVPKYIRDYLIEEAIATNDMQIVKFLPELVKKAFLAGAMAQATRKIPYLNHAVDLVVEEHRDE